MDIRCIDLKTNSVKYIPKHLTEKVGFLEKHNLKIQDFSLSLDDEIEEVELSLDGSEPKQKRRKRK